MLIVVNSVHVNPHSNRRMMTLAILLLPLQVDQVQEAWVLQQTSSEKKSEILASASANLYAYLNMTIGVSYVSKTSENFKNNYTSKRTSSNIFTEGGPPFLPSDFTATSWAESLDK